MAAQFDWAAGMTCTKAAGSVFGPLPSSICKAAERVPSARAAKRSVVADVAVTAIG